MNQQIVKIGYFFDYLKFFIGFFNVVIVPIIVSILMFKNSIYFNVLDLVYLITFGYFKIIVCFGILHRFFGHRSFSCSRTTAVVLHLIAATSAQRGALWWGSKHVRHHKYCDNEGDPHSLIREGFWYSWLGWVFMFKEVLTDWEYVHKDFKTWEMFFMECFASIVPWLEMSLYYYFTSIKTTFIIFWATWLTVYITLGFNVFLHHDNEISREPQSNGYYKCRAHNKCPNWIKYSIDLIGEMDHYDHHQNPRKAKHPSYLIDIPYWVFIYPGQKLGLFIIEKKTNTE